MISHELGYYPHPDAYGRYIGLWRPDTRLNFEIPVLVVRGASRDVIALERDKFGFYALYKAENTSENHYNAVMMFWRYAPARSELEDELVWDGHYTIKTYGVPLASTETHGQDGELAIYAVNLVSNIRTQGLNMEWKSYYLVYYPTFEIELIQTKKYGIWENKLSNKADLACNAAAAKWIRLMT